MRFSSLLQSVRITIDSSTDGKNKERRVLTLLWCLSGQRDSPEGTPSEEPTTLFVGAAGFEPTTSCAQGRRASRAALRPDQLLRFQDT